MPDYKEMPCWFLGANAPKGYFSKFDQLFLSAPEGKCFLIKGGPGTGKSTMLKKIASVLNEKGLSTELVFCAADKDSLDAVITSDGKISAVDATLPHAVEPKYPGIYETTVDLSDCWNEKMLREHAKEIFELFGENRRLHEEARKYLSSAANLLEEAAKLGMDSVSQEKTVKAAVRICEKEIGKKVRQTGTEKQRFLSAITEKGVFFFNKTPKILCKKIYLLEDDIGAVSRIFMNTVRKYALEHGFDIITCRCPLFPTEKIEHVFIPEIGLGFLTGNKRHTFEVEPFRVIHSKRFYSDKKYSRNKIRIRFSLRFASKLISEAVLCMKEAKEAHDKLESFYIPAMDFSEADKKLNKIIEEIG